MRLGPPRTEMGRGKQEVSWPGAKRPTEASERRNRPRGSGRNGRRNAVDGAGVLPLAIGDSPFGQIVGRKLHTDLVAGNDADEVLPHPSGHVGNNRVSAVQLHPKPGVGQRFGYRAINLNCFVVFRHTPTRLFGSARGLTSIARPPARNGRPLQWLFRSRRHDSRGCRAGIISVEPQKPIAGRVSLVRHRPVRFAHGRFLGAWSSSATDGAPSNTALYHIRSARPRKVTLSADPNPWFCRSIAQPSRRSHDRGNRKQLRKQDAVRTGIARERAASVRPQPFSRLCGTMHCTGTFGIQSCRNSHSDRRTTDPPVVASARHSCPDGAGIAGTIRPLICADDPPMGIPCSVEVWGGISRPTSDAAAGPINSYRVGLSFSD